MKPQVLHRIPWTPPLAKRPRAALAETVFEIVAVMLSALCLLSAARMAELLP